MVYFHIHVFYIHIHGIFFIFIFFIFIFMVDFSYSCIYIHSHVTSLYSYSCCFSYSSFNFIIHDCLIIHIHGLLLHIHGLLIHIHGSYSYSCLLLTFMVLKNVLDLQKIILPFFGKANSFWSVESKICIPYRPQFAFQ